LCIVAASLYSDKGKFHSDLNAARNVNMSEYALNQSSLRMTLNHRVPGPSPGAPTNDSAGTWRFSCAGDFPRVSGLAHKPINERGANKSRLVSEAVPEAVAKSSLPITEGTPINIGGPGRTRTCNQTVMSGRIKVGSVDFIAFSSEFDCVCRALAMSFLVRNWCGSPAIEMDLGRMPRPAACRFQLSDLSTMNLGDAVRISSGGCRRRRKSF
jgi:hypothetical protein